MPATIGSLLCASLALMLVGGCAVARVQEPDPGEIPAGPLGATGSEATGPIVELGRGRTLGMGWRYSIYPSAEGWCTQLETISVGSASCGGLLPSEGATFGSIGSSGGSDGPSPVEGIVSDDAAEVWLVGSAGQRVETTLMPLAKAGLEGKAFVGFAPEGVTARSIVAIGADGREIEARDLP